MQITRTAHNQPACPFCDPDSSRIILSHDCAIAFNDGYPVTPGHSLIVPKRHISSFFESTREEQTALLDLLAEMRQLLLAERNPDGFNIGAHAHDTALVEIQQRFL